MLHAWRLREATYAPALANIRMANLLAYHQVQKQYQEQLKLSFARFGQANQNVCKIDEPLKTTQSPSLSTSSINNASSTSRKYTRHPKALRLANFELFYEITVVTQNSQFAIRDISKTQ